MDEVEAKYFPTGHDHLSIAVGDVLDSIDDPVPERAVFSSVVELIRSRSEQFGQALSQLDMLVAFYNSSWIFLSDYPGMYMQNYPVAQKHGVDIGMYDLPYISTLIPSNEIKEYDAKERKTVLLKKEVKSDTQPDLISAVGRITLTAAEVQLIMLDGPDGTTMDASSSEDHPEQNNDLDYVLDTVLVSTMMQLYFELLANKHKDIDVDLVRAALIELMPLRLERSSLLFDATVSRDRLNYLSLSEFTPAFINMVDNRLPISVSKSSSE